MESRELLFTRLICSATMGLAAHCNPQFRKKKKHCSFPLQILEVCRLDLLASRLGCTKWEPRLVFPDPTTSRARHLEEEVASSRSDSWEKLTSLAIVHGHVRASNADACTSLCRRPMRDSVVPREKTHGKRLIAPRAQTGL